MAPPTSPVSSLVTKWENFKKAAPPPPKKPLGTSIATDPGISGQPKQLNQRGRSISANPPEKKAIPQEILNFKRSISQTEIPVPTSKKSLSFSPKDLTRRVLENKPKGKSSETLNIESMTSMKMKHKNHEYKQTPEKAKDKIKGKWEKETTENIENLEALRKILAVAEKHCHARLLKISDQFEKMSEDIQANLETLVSKTMTSFDEAAKQTKKDSLSNSMPVKRDQCIVPTWQYVIEDSLEKLKTLNLIIKKTGEYCEKEEINNAFPFVFVNSTLHSSLNDLVKRTLNEFEGTIIRTKVAFQYSDLCDVQEKSLDVFFERVRDFITRMQDLNASLQEKDVYIVVNGKKDKKFQEVLVTALSELLKKDNIWMQQSFEDFKKAMHSDKQFIIRTFLLFKDYFKAVRHVGKVYIDQVGYKVPRIMLKGEEYYSPKEKAKTNDRRPASAYLYGISREMSQFWDIMEKGIEQADEIVKAREKLGFPFFVELTLHNEFKHLQDKVLKTFQSEINRSSILYKQKMEGNLHMHQKIP